MDDPISADTFAHDLSDRMLACRELGHTWRPFTVQVVPSSVVGRRVGGYERVMRCSQCRTERVQLLDSHGGIVRNGYNYRPGYLANHVQPGFTRDVFRLESITRWLDKHSGKDGQ